MNIRFILFLLISVFVFHAALTAELSEAAKEAIEKAKSTRESISKSREEQKLKNAAGSYAEATAIPGKLLYRGNIERCDIKDAQATSILIRLSNGKKLEVPYSPIFIKDNAQLALNNVLTGMEVAIVNDVPTVQVAVIAAPDAAAAAPAPAPSAEPVKIPDCQINASTKIYCGSDASHLEKYFPPAQKPKPGKEVKKENQSPKKEKKEE